MLPIFDMRFLLILVLLFLGACSQSEIVSSETTSEANLLIEAAPSTLNPIQDSGFHFAIFGDLTGGERAGVFEKAIDQINNLGPEFIINVGDLVDGAKNDTTEWYKQWDNFDRRAHKATSKLFYVAGNHDATGELSQAIWKERNGPLYYHFIYKNNLFLVLNSEDNDKEDLIKIDSMRNQAIEIYKSEGYEAYQKSAYFNSPLSKYGNVRNDQVSYFVNVIEKNPNVNHTFIFVHKPIWKKENEQQFKRIESALKDKAYTVFNGHTHCFDYELRYDRDYINLSTTGGGQYPEFGPSFDHISWVYVNGKNVSISHLKMEGILDKEGK